MTGFFCHRFLTTLTSDHIVTTRPLDNMSVAMALLTIIAFVIIVAFYIFFFYLLASTSVMWRIENFSNFSVLQGLLEFMNERECARGSPDRSAMQHCRTANGRSCCSRKLVIIWLVTLNYWMWLVQLQKWDGKLITSDENIRISQ
jgi:hypothetical protein